MKYLIKILCIFVIILTANSDIITQSEKQDKSACLPLSTYSDYNIRINVMRTPIEELQKQQFGRLTVIKDAGKNKHKQRMVIAKCECGTERQYAVYNLVTGHIQGCGCIQIESRTKHNLTGTRIYHIWENMKQRCTNPKNDNYECYGDRGIMLCDRWIDFQNFYNDMSPTYQDNLQIDRIDNDGNYEPSNCRWVDRITQMNNCRQVFNAKGYTYDKRRKCYNANIVINSKNKYLGSYKTAEEASQAYQKAKEIKNAQLV